MSESAGDTSVPSVCTVVSNSTARAPDSVGTDANISANTQVPPASLDKAMLPPYSVIVQEALTSDKIHNDHNWRQFVLETAFFYIGLIPTAEGPARVSYSNIGRTVYEKYPCIASKGHVPWTYFCSALSSKIRQLRLKRKQDLACSDPQSACAPAKKLNRRQPKTVALAMQETPTRKPLSEVDFNSHLTEIKLTLDVEAKKKKFLTQADAPVLYVCGTHVCLVGYKQQLVSCQNVKQGIIALIGAYYVFQINYDQKRAALMNLLQHVLVEESKNLPKKAQQLLRNLNM